MSPPARRAGIQHDRLQQRRHRPGRARQNTPGNRTSPRAATRSTPTPPATATSALVGARSPIRLARQRRPRHGRRPEPDHRLGQHQHRQCRRRRGERKDSDRHPPRPDRAYIAGISGKPVSANAQPVLVSPNGKLGTAPAPVGVHRIARGDRRAAAAPGRPAAKAAEGRLIEALVRRRPCPGRQAGEDTARAMSQENVERPPFYAWSDASPVRPLRDVNG